MRVPFFTFLPVIRCPATALPPSSENIATATTRIVTVCLLLLIILRIVLLLLFDLCEMRGRRNAPLGPVLVGFFIGRLMVQLARSRFLTVAAKSFFTVAASLSRQ